MKRFISLIIVGCFGLMMAQDAAGTYKLTGTNVRYTSLLRQTSTVSATDAYGLGVTIPLATFPINAPAGQLINGPFNEDNLELSGAFLNVTFNEDGTGTVNEGSYYPTLDLDEETCITTGAALPITDELVYTSNLTPANYVQTTTLLGIPSLSPFSGGFIGGISLSQSSELDFFTFGQSAGALGACGAGFYADGSPCDASYPGNDCAIYEACMSAGYVSKGHDIETVEGNGVRDMYVEWHAIDGPLSQSGFGDDETDPCEDDLCVANADQDWCLEADGSVSPACTAELEAFDRILGVPGLPSTIMNPDCGYGDFIVGGSDLVGPALAGGVLATCTAGVQTDLDENGFADVVDPFAGSYYIESLTDRIIFESEKLIKKIDDLGGSINALNMEFQQNEIAHSAYEFQKKIDTKERIIVGVNKFINTEETLPELQSINQEETEKQINKIKIFKQSRNQVLVNKSLEELKNNAKTNNNLFQYIINALKSKATLGEISDTLRDVFGEYA